MNHLTIIEDSSVNPFMFVPVLCFGYGAYETDAIMMMAFGFGLWNATKYLFFAHGGYGFLKNVCQSPMGDDAICCEVKQ
eukprot:10263607-Ditylum_brightwellii.AAC.1